MKLNFIDLFCGAGGLSNGFESRGHKLILALDSDKYSIATKNHNKKNNESMLINMDLKKFILSEKSKVLDLKIDMVIGGPPCQGFSTANRQNILDDPRNELYKYFINFIELTKPKFLIIENVEGIKNKAADIIKRLSNEYFVDFRKLYAQDFGIPQNRKRVFFFGVRKKQFNLHHIHDFFFNLKNKASENKKFKLSDALFGLRKLQSNKVKFNTDLENSYSGFNIEKIENYKENEYLKIINGGKKVKEIYNHKARYNNDRDIKIFKTLPQGKDSTHESIKDIMPYSNRSNIFKDKYFKLENDKICKTITSHMKNDCNMYIHPTQARGLTPREAARIQSFSDNYFFCGPLTKCYQQIGNAVPPLLSKALAESLESIL